MSNLFPLASEQQADRDRKQENSTPEFKHVELYGGAITVDLPETFEDVSQIRQIPDHQEVYLDRDGFSSIVFDILERVPNDNDEEALKYHLRDIVESDAAQTTLHSSIQDSVKLAKMPGTKALTLLATCPAGSKMKGRPNEPDLVAVLLLLIRLEEQKTDLLVAVNIPHMPGQYVKEEVQEGKGKAIEIGMEVRERLLETFEVRDWGLFVGEWVGRESERNR